ncbi:NAD(P)-binding protein [Plenodomus tracheiphilus IPT5]|uniref:NAD(P)-binding protein n=1 Tax=Plenodomus tracheiphilus IPT5 TaxID=1408161 RepID=A0A6A7AX41_9PLEO|nr:NAD(P)-binding protein [Plenodomus tracheiphilus IPT5]
MAHQNRLANTHVLIFGGTSGIGYAIANMALSYGARVTISGSGQPKVDAKVELLRSLYPNNSASNVSGFAVDLLDKQNLETNLRAMLDKVTESGTKKVDHIAFTAGDAISLPKVPTATVDEILHSFTIRLIAPCIIAKLLATGDYMPRSADSSFTITGGTNTHRPMPGWTYGAAIGGSVEGLTRGLAVDLAPIRANAVIPGAIQTELLQGFLEQAGPEAVENMRKGFSLTGDFGKPEDIAEAYGWVMKDRFANGGMVTSDGGRLLVGT